MLEKETENMLRNNIRFNIVGKIEDLPDKTRDWVLSTICLLYTSPSPRDRTRSRMPSSA